MATAQRGIFHEGTAFHWFLQFRVAPEARAEQIGGAIRELRDAADSGPPPEAVSAVVAFGADLLRRIAPSALPPQLRDFAPITGTSGRIAPSTQCDLFVWLHSNRYDRNFEIATVARRALAGIGEIAFETPAFVYRDSRDLTGFVDGTENPSADEAMSLAVTPAGGSFVLAQRWVHDLDAFHSLALADQEAVIGRTKGDSVELDGKPPTAHIARVVVEDEAGDEIEIYRRSVPYGTASEAGLFFLAFTDDLAKIDLMLARMFGATGDRLHDRLVEFSQPVAGAYYYAPPLEVLGTL